MSNGSRINIKTLTSQQKSFLHEWIAKNESPSRIAIEFNQHFNPPSPISDRQVTGWKTYHQKQWNDVEYRRTKYAALTSPEPPHHDPISLASNSDQPKTNPPFLDSGLPPLVQSRAPRQQVLQRDPVFGNGHLASANEHPAFANNTAGGFGAGHSAFVSQGASSEGDDRALSDAYALSYARPASGQIPGAARSQTLPRASKRRRVGDYPAYDRRQGGGGQIGPMGRNMSSSTAPPNVMRPLPPSRRSTKPFSPRAPMGQYINPPPNFQAPGMLAKNAFGSQALGQTGTGYIPAGIISPEQISQGQAVAFPEEQEEIKATMPYEGSRGKKLVPLKNWHFFLQNFSPRLDGIPQDMQRYLTRNLMSDLTVFGRTPAQDFQGDLEVFVYTAACTPVEAKGVDRDGIWYIGAHDKCGRGFVHRHKWNGDIDSNEAGAIDQWKMRQSGSDVAETCTQNLVREWLSSMRDQDLQPCPMIVKSNRAHQRNGPPKRKQPQEQEVNPNSDNRRVERAPRQDRLAQLVPAPIPSDNPHSQPPPHLPAQPAVEGTQQSYQPPADIFFDPRQAPQNHVQLPVRSYQQHGNRDPPYQAPGPDVRAQVGVFGRRGKYPVYSDRCALPDVSPPPWREIPRQQDRIPPYNWQGDQPGEQEASLEAPQQGAGPNDDFYSSVEDWIPETDIIREGESVEEMRQRLSFLDGTTPSPSNSDLGGTDLDQSISDLGGTNLGQRNSDPG